VTRILITGATGLLGQVVTTDLGQVHEVTALVHNRRFVGPTPVQVAVDLTEGKLAQRVWATERPDLVIHTAALASIDLCEANPDLARVLNCEVAGTVARLCRDHGSKLVHISTDAVFDGSAGPYREDDAPLPVSVYARTKLDGEKACLDVLPDALVARVNFFGPSGPPRRGLACFFLDSFSRGEAVNGFVDVEFTPAYSRDLGELLIEAAEAGISGIRHFGGRDRLSKYDFGRLVAEVFGYDSTLVRKASVDVLGTPARRISHLSMDSRLLASELGRPMPSPREGLERMRDDLAGGYEARLVRELADTLTLTRRGPHGFHDRRQKRG
jgi:dTDP-4-dehydrorhamnose reductase